MADKKISALTAATTPLAGTEVLPIVQGGATVKVSVDNLTAGKPVSMSNLTYTGTATGGTGIVNLGSGQFYKDASGNVGINTTSPDAMLDIERETASGTGPAARFYRNQTTIENLRGLSIYGNQSGGFVDSTVVFGNTTNSYLAFGHHNGTSYSERMRIDSAGNVGIGATANASAILDAQSTTKGVRMPNMTTTQKNAIASPAAGLMVFDTTLSKLCVYSGAAWQTVTSI